jgi:Ca2+-transporting ATPase
VLIGLVSLAAFAADLALRGDLAEARTVGMCTLVVSQLIHAFDARSETRSVWQLGLFTNPALVAATASSMGVLLAVLYAPALAALFHAVPLGPLAWFLVVAASGLGAVLAGAGRLARRRRRLRRRGSARAA